VFGSSFREEPTVQLEDGLDILRPTDVSKLYFEPMGVAIDTLLSASNEVLKTSRLEAGMFRRWFFVWKVVFERVVLEKVVFEESGV